MAFPQVAGVRYGTGHVAIPNFFRHMHRIAATFAQVTHRLVHRNRVREPVAGSGQRPRRKVAAAPSSRQTPPWSRPPDAPRRRPKTAASSLPLAGVAALPAISDLLPAWHLRRPGTSRQDDQVTHERHNSRRARAGRRADRTLQHGAGPGPGPQSVVGGRTGHRGGQVAGHGAASPDDPQRERRQTAAAHQRGGLTRVNAVGRPGKRPWILSPLSRAILHSRTSRSSWSIASRRALVGCRFHRRRLLPGRISWRSR